MQIKTNDDGHAIIEDDQIILVDDKGKESKLDPVNAAETIAELRSENAKNRKNLRAAENKLDAFKDIDDPDAAIAALQTVATLDDDHKKAIDNLKKEMGTAHKDQLKEKTDRIAVLEAQNFSLAIGDKFHTSETAKKLVIPPARQKDLFARHFKLNDQGVLVGELDGKEIYSTAKPGELADFEEAYEKIIEAQPDKNILLRASGARGSGAPPAGSVPPADGGQKTSREKIAAGLAEKGLT